MKHPPAPQEKNKKGTKTAWWRWPITAVFLGIFVYLFLREGTDEVFRAIRSIPLEVFAGALGILTISRFTVAARWQQLANQGGKMTYWRALQLTYAGLFASNFLPTTIGGDVVRFFGALQSGMESGAAAASLLMDRLVGMAGMTCFLPFGLARVWPVMTGNINTTGASAAGFLGGIISKARKFISEVWTSVQYWLRHPRRLLFSFACTLVHMWLYFNMIGVLIRALGGSLSFWEIGAIYSLTYFISQIPISISGWGLQEVSVTYLFSVLGGLDVQASLALAVLMRVFYILATLPGVLSLPGILEAKKYAEAQNTQNNE